MSRTDDSTPIAEGTVAGAAAFAAGYVATYLLAGPAVRESVLATAAGETWRAVGWVFYNAQFVDVVGSLSAFGLTVTGRTNFVASRDGLSAALYLVAPLALALAGVAVGRSLRSEEPRAGVAAGLLLVPAYLLSVLAGVVVLRRTGDLGWIGPDLATAALAGVAYPAVFGVLGALAGQRT